jgi:hypothetical protein
LFNCDRPIQHRAIAFANAPQLAGRSLIRKKHLQSRYSAKEQQGDRLLFDYGGDRLCKCSTTGRAIAPQKQAQEIAPAFPQGF